MTPRGRYEIKIEEGKQEKKHLLVCVGVFYRYAVGEKEENERGGNTVSFFIFFRGFVASRKKNQCLLQLK